MATISREIPTPAKGEPEALPPTIRHTAGMVSRYSTTSRSAVPEKAENPQMGMNSMVTARLTMPTTGAHRYTVRLAWCGMMVSLPISLKKS